ncbi:hypothetical protein GCM10020367_59550 [Streptomyces sannanensis]|uniref:DUF35 domain-containing protein n=2 Tax=Streptomyces sannanensis TaxID=285536 RepID=A0ABP6SKL8_9ACTN
MQWEHSEGVGSVLRIISGPRPADTRHCTAVIGMPEGFHVRATVVCERPGDIYVGATARLTDEGDSPTGLPVFRLRA